MKEYIEKLITEISEMDPRTPHSGRPTPYIFPDVEGSGD